MAPEIAVAIDFGTTRSAWAYRVSGQADNKILVRIPDTARAAPSSTTKTETVALFGRRGRGELRAFGPAAIQQYAEDDDEQDALFRWFKLDLCKTASGQTTADCLTTTSTAGHTAPLLPVVTASLRYFKDDVLSFLSSTSGRLVRARDIRWIVTVPAIYDDFAKNFMRQAAHEAGMIDKASSTKLRLCLEPEAACLAVTMEDNPLTCEAEGKTMMIVDCGGGTVDITTYKIVSVDSLNLAEVVAPQGGMWGSTRVDSEFKTWLRRFLGKWFDTIMKTETLVSIMMTWERKKAEFPGQDPTQPLRLNFSSLAQYGMTMQDIEGLRARHNDGLPSAYRVGGKKFMVNLSTTVVTSFFTPMLEKIGNCLQQVKENPDIGELHRVYVVGGFSRCPLLREVVEDVFQESSCSVVQVHEPDIAIVKGAVMFFDHSTVFNSRKARLSYGVAILAGFDDKNPKHLRRRDAGDTSTHTNGRTCVDNAFDVHIAIGDDIPADGILSRRCYRPFSLPQKTGVVRIYASTERGPEFVD
ncbi:unnamed protein product, partial [Hapterophycus canaliculatus]